MAKHFSQITFDFAPSPEVVRPEEKAEIPSVIDEEPIDISEPLEVVAKKHKAGIQAGSGKRGRKSLKDMDINVDLVSVPEDEILFQKQYYSMGEVAAMFKENQSLIRYWETEFDILQPKKNKKGDRFFRPVDVKNLVMIYDLLRRRKFTIEGARDYLKNNKKADEKFAMIQSLRKVRSFLLELKSSL